jgi:uncharacterized protein DUF928
MHQNDGRNGRFILIGALLTLGIFGLDHNLGFAQADKKSAAPSDPSKPVTVPEGARPLTYNPPLRGNPAGRVGGGTRGGAPERSVVLSLLTPDHVGLTTQEQPNLFWYISQPTSHAVEVTVIENQAVKPLLETPLRSPTQGGIQRISLKDYNVRLRTGAQYRWYIAVVPDPKNRSKDILAGGFIERIEATEALRKRLAEAGAEQSAFVYAEEGIWYDALATLSDLIEKAPGDSKPRLQRVSLLEQVRLQQVADFDRDRR